jgi:Tol biopolymer transport system component
MTRLYVRDLRGGDVRPIADTAGATYPFWSPDSRSIGFFADGKLKRIDVDGTRSTVISDDVDGRGATWAPDGTIVVAPSSTSGLSRIRATGGKTEEVVKLSGDQTSLRFPWFLPDGKHFLYFAMSPHHRGLHIASIDGRLNRKLLETSGSAVFSDNSVVFLRDGALFAQSLDRDSLQLVGEPRQIASGVSGKDNSFGFSGMSVSTGGDLLFPSEFTPKSLLVWRDRTGAVLKSLPAERMFYEPALALDEKSILATSDDPPDSLWEVDVERGRARRLAAGPVPAAGATWSRDGKRIVFLSTSDGKPALAALSSSGGSLEVVATLPQTLYPETFSSDGTVVVLDGPSPNGKDFDLWMLNMADRKVSPMVSGPSNALRAQFSPDGRFFAYSSDETGRAEIFVQTWPLSESKWQVTFAGGDQAFWRGDGKELFYLSPDGKMMSAAVQHGETIAFADPVELFQSPLLPVSMTGNRNQYLVTRDGQRFLLLESATSSPTHLTLVQNFRRLLEQSR